jgi:hypothetical protein
MRKLRWLLPLLLILPAAMHAQVTQPVNGVADNRQGCYAFTNATIVKDAQTTLKNGTMVIREGRIVSVGTAAALPADAITIDCNGKFIYPSFIDLYSDYGIALPQRAPGGFNFNAPAQLNSNTKGAYGWNQAIKADVEAIP